MFFTIYLAYMLLATVFAVLSGIKAAHRAGLSGSTHYAWCVVSCCYYCWVGSYYDVKRHRVYMFPIPFIGIMVDYDFSPNVED
jgi:hypothetical protein